MMKLRRIFPVPVELQRSGSDNELQIAEAVWYLDVTLPHLRYVKRTLTVFFVNDQRDTQIIFCVFISIYNSLHVSST